ncbi:MAG: hypothetical protein IKH27_11320, partial [Oscillospiraceae bacterium]|nr:hypothetical protein [Oscillospiraceae bacterium]
MSLLLSQKSAYIAIITYTEEKSNHFDAKKRRSAVGMSMIGDRFLPKKYEAPELESPAYGGSHRRPEQAGLSGTHMTARY